MIRILALAAALLTAASAAAETAKPAPPWVRLVAPDRMCIRFGEYDWQHYLRETDRIRQTGLGHDAALARERALGEALWYLGRGTGRICSCTGREVVLRSLKALLPELRKRPTVRYQDMPATAHVEGVIAGIEAEGIAVVPPMHEGCKR